MRVIRVLIYEGKDDSVQLSLERRWIKGKVDLGNGDSITEVLIPPERSRLSFLHRLRLRSTLR